MFFSLFGRAGAQSRICSASSRRGDAERQYGRGTHEHAEHCAQVRFGDSDAVGANWHTWTTRDWQVAKLFRELFVALGQRSTQRGRDEPLGPSGQEMVGLALALGCELVSRRSERDG